MTEPTEDEAVAIVGVRASRRLAGRLQDLLSDRSDRQLAKQAAIRATDDGYVGRRRSGEILEPVAR